MNYRSDQLLGVIGAVRKRRNLLNVLRGLAITVAATAVTLVITGLAAYRFRFSAAALVSLRIFAALSVTAAVHFALVRPLRRRRSTRAPGRRETSRRRGALRQRDRVLRRRYARGLLASDNWPSG